MERKWTSLNGKEYSFTIEQVLKEFDPAFKSKNSYSISPADAAQALTTWEIHQLDPYIDGWFVPKRGGAVYIVGYMFILKKVGQLPYYDGFDQPKDIYDKHGNLVAVEVSVWRKDRTRPTTWRVEFDEFAARKKDGSLTEMWQVKGKFMLRKVGVVIPHRIAFAAELQNLYIAEEFKLDEEQTTDLTTSKPKIEPVESPKESEIPIDAQKKIAKTWSDKMKEASSLEELEKVGVSLKKANIKFDKEIYAEVANIYKDERKKLLDKDMEPILADYEKQDKVIELLSNFSKETKKGIEDVINSITDEGIRQALLEQLKAREEIEGGDE